MRLKAASQCVGNSSCKSLCTNQCVYRMKCVTVGNRSHSLCSYLDELLEELDSLAELAAEADFSDDPQLNLVEPPQE